MTEEELRQYDAQREKLELMTPEERMERLDEIRTEVFIMANSFAGDNGLPGIATSLHESANHIMHAQKIFEGKEEPGIPMAAIARACGMDIPGMIDLLAGNLDSSKEVTPEPGRGTSLLDLQTKDDQYREDLENEDG